MKKKGYYSSGEFARIAQVTLRTIRYYDKQDILKPSFVNDSGARFYTDKDLAHLQQILLLKYLGFSLDDIREMTIANVDSHFSLNSLHLQKKLVQDRIEQMQLVENAIGDTITAIEQNHQIDWRRMLELIHLTGMEKSLKNQYQNATNISARINLHTQYSTNKQGWFPWIYKQCHCQDHMQILELGCGSGALWTENKAVLPQHIHIILSDISDGMLRDTRRTIGSEDDRFIFNAFDCHKIPYKDKQFDLILANHVLFYCENISQVFQEIHRTLRPNGLFICSTYGADHMKEISQLVQEFDSRIVLSAEKLYERFGLENGRTLLEPYFGSILCEKYEDCIQNPRSEALIEYILSCHGNQNQLLLDRYKEFRTFVEKKTKRNFLITKDAGIFLCHKEKIIKK